MYFWWNTRTIGPGAGLHVRLSSLLRVCFTEAILNYS